MSNLLKNNQKFNDKEIIGFFVKYLTDHGDPEIKVETWPDEEERQSTEIDALAGTFAIEHTSIDIIPDQRRDAAYFVQVVKSLEDEFRGKLTFRLILTFPYDGIKTGQDWPKIKTALRNWVLAEAPKLSIGHHVINDVPDVSFEFYANKRSSNRTGVLFGRFVPYDKTLPARLRQKLDRKVEKLSRYKGQNKTTILLVESDDIALMNDEIIRDGLRLAYPDGLPQGLDQIWLADTSIPEDILFTEMTQVVVR